MFEIQYHIERLPLRANRLTVYYLIHIKFPATPSLKMVFFRRKLQNTNEDSKTTQTEMSPFDDSPLDGRLRLLERMFKFTLLTFRDISEEGTKISKIRLLLTILIMMLSGYLSAHFIYSVITVESKHTALTVFMCVTTIQCFISETFVIYWQFGGFQMIWSSQLAHSRSKSKTAKARIICVYVIVGLILVTFVLWSTYSIITYYRTGVVLSSHISSIHYWVFHTF